MAINTTNFDEALRPGINKWYGAEYADHPEIYSKIFDVKNSTQMSEYSMSMAAFGLVPVKAQGQPISYADTQQGYKNTLTHISYALGFPVTYEMAKFNQYGIVELLSRSLAKSVRQTIETIDANHLNNAFSSSYVGADGKELCATDHPKLYGGTWQNEPTTAADFSMTSWEQARIDIGSFVDDRGLKIAANIKQAIFPIELESSAAQLFGSEKDPESNFNAINPFYNKTKYITNPYLTDPDAWFVQTDVMNGLVHYWADKPKFERNNDSDSKNAKYSTFFIFTSGWNDPRNIYGSPGA